MSIPLPIAPLPLLPDADKPALRKAVKRRATDAGSRVLEAASQQIVATLETHPLWIDACTVALYWATPLEVDTRELIRRWHPRKRILLPVMQGEELILRPFTGENYLKKHPWGVWEPAGNETADPSEIDLMIVPGAAFTPDGGRLGYGKGFYDRLLARAQDTCRKIPFPTIGICFDFQLYEQLPRQAHDIAVDGVIAGSAEGALARYGLAAQKRK